MSLVLSVTYEVSFQRSTNSLPSHTIPTSQSGALDLLASVACIKQEEDRIKNMLWKAAPRAFYDDVPAQKQDTCAVCKKAAD
ncbi:hypothetical protein ONZ51_g3132 [Trametes cubensis]|uniref:Uncharacterized protein n=1 Tax=Trametes cubensis TaxID=1111947 RepID=A0AAD7XDA6_9APHY|nr:hypothetical protein ONZ51_g3132 [Trametes cubensis]